MFVRQKTLNYLYGIESIMSGMTYVPFNHPSSSAPIAFNHSLLILIIPPPRNEVVGGYTGFTMSVRLSVNKSYVV
jgi:hypothetical protein